MLIPLSLQEEAYEEEVDGDANAERWDEGQLLGEPQSHEHIEEEGL